jgi:site-specific DNA-methyltransferase (adenine-specific)
MTNKLFYGDNLDVLRTFPDESVDLVYLDPPFNSNAGYNVLFRAADGAGADASIEAFDDTWTWGDTAREALLDIASGTNRPLTVMMNAMHSAIGENPLMAYLAMMAVRLVELHRVLKATGTSDLPGRISQHREGVIPGFAKRYAIKRLVWFEAHDQMDSAIAREKRIKRWLRDWKYALIGEANPTWRDLAEDLGFDPLPRPAAPLALPSSSRT